MDDTDDWLERWMPRHLPPTFLSAKRWANRQGRADDDFVYSIPGPRNPPWKETVAFLRGCAARAEAKRKPNAIPIEYEDPKAQAAFEAVYRNRLYMLRVFSLSDEEMTMGGLGSGRKKATHAYIGMNEKGECRAIVYDDPGKEEETAIILAAWTLDGRTIERLPIPEARKKFDGPVGVRVTASALGQGDDKPR